VSLYPDGFGAEVERAPPCSEILQALESLEQLEILLVLVADSAQAHTSEMLLRKTVVRAVDLLEIRRHLVSKGLAVCDEEGALRLSEDPSIQAGAAELLRQFREDPLQIIGPLSTGALERARFVVESARMRALLVGRE
jgi:hypothetical protein